MMKRFAFAAHQLINNKIQDIQLDMDSQIIIQLSMVLQPITIHHQLITHKPALMIIDRTADMVS